MRARVIAALVAALLVLPHVGRAAAPTTCPGASPSGEARVVTGTFDESYEGSYVMVPFEVGHSSTKVELKLCYDQPDSPASAEIKHTLDLGIYDATSDGFHDEN
jgi:hypothetical protein